MIRDLALIVAAAALVTLIFHRLRLPVVLGYLLTGLALSPFLNEFPVLQAREGIEQLNSLGVLFLMFTLGLNFDLGRLRGVFWPALLATLLQTAVIFFLGVVCAPLFGFSQKEGLLLGAVLTSSGVIISLCLLHNKNRLQYTDAHLLIGILLLEAVVAIAFLILLSGYAIAGGFTSGTVLRALFLIAVFTIGVYLLGRIIAPRVATFLRTARGPELVTMVTIALVLGLSELARLSEVSQALGAFVAGAVLARTVLQREIRRVTEPFRDLFCALFFVSFAMLANTRWLLDYLPELILITLLVAATKIVLCWIGLFIGGQPTETSLRASLPKAGVGEFGFIIAGFSYKLGLISDKLLAVALALAIGTYIVAIAASARPERVYNYFAERTPAPLARAARIYGRMLDAIGRYIGRRTFLHLARTHLTRLPLYVLLLAVVIAAGYLGSQWLQQSAAIERSEYWLKAGVWLGVAAVCTPILAAMLHSLDALVVIITDATLRYSSEPQLLAGRMRKLAHTTLQCLVLVLFGGLLLAAASAFFPSGITLAIFIGLFVLVSLLFWRSINSLNGRIEYLFYQSFQAHSRQDDAAVRQSVLQELAQKYPWDAKVVEHVIDLRSVACGHRIADLRIRKQTGATIIAIRRGGWTYFSPSQEVPLFPGDTVVLFGSAHQTGDAVRMLSVQGPAQPIAAAPDAGAQPTAASASAESSASFTVKKVFVSGLAPLVGLTLVESDVQKSCAVSVLGIQRGATRIVPVAADELIHAGDLLLVTGSPAAVQRFAELCAREEDELPPAFGDTTQESEV